MIIDKWIMSEHILITSHYYIKCSNLFVERSLSSSFRIMKGYFKPKLTSSCIMDYLDNILEFVKFAYTCASLPEPSPPPHQVSELYGR